MPVNLNQKKKTCLLLLPQKKQKKNQKTTAFYTYHTDSVKLAASMKLEFFF